MIIPGILEKYWSDIEDKIEIVYNRSLSGVDLSSQNIIYREKVKKIQIDFCDGLYVNNKTWSPLKESREINSILEKGLPHWENFDYEADLMVDNICLDSDGLSNMHKYIEAVAMLGFSCVVLHSDDETKLVEAILKAKEYMLSVGISSRDINLIIKLLNNQDYIDKIDYVQIMGIDNIGHQNEPFDESVIEKIKLIRETLNKINADKENEKKESEYNISIKGKIRIQIDGAMNNETIQMCRDYGADDFVMGSAYFGK